MIKKRIRKGRQIVRSKRVTIDGFNFASTIEGYMYTLLRDEGIQHTYEGKTYRLFNPLKLPSPCYEVIRKSQKELRDRRSVTKIDYTPDFIGVNEEWFIEVKGRANESFPLRWKPGHCAEYR